MGGINPKVKILLYADAIWYFGDGMLGPLFAVFTQRIGGDILEITWAWATYLMAGGLLTILVGKISDEKIKKEKLLVLGYALNAVFTFSYLFVSTSAQLFLVQIGMGVAVALATPTWNAVYAKSEDKKIAGLEWGLADGLAQFLSGVAVVIGGLLVSRFSFKALFLVMGIVQTMSALAISQIVLFKKHRA
ncbi:MAG: MFS transporter [Patescibacteria group bacterium]